jgi:hypothetical protein
MAAKWRFTIEKLINITFYGILQLSIRTNQFFPVNFDRSGFGKSTPLAALETGRTWRRRQSSGTRRRSWRSGSAAPDVRRCSPEDRTSPCSWSAPCPGSCGRRQCYKSMSMSMSAEQCLCYSLRPVFTTRVRPTWLLGVKTLYSSLEQRVYINP